MHKPRVLKLLTEINYLFQLSKGEPSPSTPAVHISNLWWGFSKHWSTNFIAKYPPMSPKPT